MDYLSLFQFPHLESEELASIAKCYEFCLKIERDTIFSKRYHVFGKVIYHYLVKGSMN